MADNLNEHSEQIIGLTELMVQTLQATIDADRSTADEYYRILEENSFKEGHDGTAELQMVDVRLSNSNGQTQILSVPKMLFGSYSTDENSFLGPQDDSNADSDAAYIGG